MIFAFETATDICSVAFQNSTGKVFEKRIQGRSVHSEHLFLFTEALTKEHNFSVKEIETVLVSNGPGSYTGLRIAASAVKGMFFGLDVNLFAVNTLAGFAAGIESGIIHSIIDARRTHVYHQSFEKKQKLHAESNIEIKEIRELENELRDGVHLVGTGINRLTSESRSKVNTLGAEAISATHLIHLYNTQPDSTFFQKTTPEALDPDYITSNQVNNSPS